MGEGRRGGGGIAAFHTAPVVVAPHHCLSRARRIAVLKQAIHALLLCDDAVIVEHGVCVTRAEAGNVDAIPPIVDIDDVGGEATGVSPIVFREVKGMGQVCESRTGGARA